jgi:hypothetical protein
MYDIGPENYSLLHISGRWAGILRQQKRRFMGLLRLVPTDLLQEHRQGLQIMQGRLMDRKDQLLPLSVIESKN